jgi:hypothetical protein
MNQVDDNKLFDQYKICKNIGKYGTEDKVRKCFQLFDIAVCYGAWRKNRSEIIEELDLLPSKDRYYFPILDALIKSSRGDRCVNEEKSKNEEKIKRILNSRPYVRSVDSLTPLFSCLRAKSATLFSLVLDKITILDRGIVSGDFTSLVSLAFKNELFPVVDLLVAQNYGNLELYDFLAQGQVKTKAQLDYILLNAISLTQVLCIAIKPKILSESLLNYFLEIFDAKFKEFPVAEIVNYCFLYNLSYSLDWMIKNKRIKITEIKWQDEFVNSSSCLKVVAKYKHPQIPKNIEAIWSKQKYTFCKEIILNYIIGENGKIDENRKYKLLTKYPNKLLQKIFEEYQS